MSHECDVAADSGADPEVVVVIESSLNNQSLEQPLGRRAFSRQAYAVLSGVGS